MKNLLYLLIELVVILLLVSSCGNRGSQEMFDPQVWTEDIEYDSYSDISAQSVCIPYTEKNGVKYITVQINGGPIYEMIVDTGCSGVLISIKEAQYLAQSGLLTEADYKGKTLSSIADGSIVENMVFNIREMVIGGEIECSNVDVTVSKNITAPMLLGNGIFDRISSFTIDNTNKKIIFHL